MSRIIHTGQALVDLVVEVPGLPTRGGNVMARTATRYAGGAVSTLLAAARMGAEAVHSGSVGTGPHGDLVREVLGGDGIPVTSPRVESGDTGICVVLLEPEGERTFVTTLGAERSISVASLATSAPEDGDVVCLSGYSLLGQTCAPLLAFLATLPAGVQVVLDPGAAFAGLDADLRSRVLARTTVWTSNAAEASELTGVAEVADTLPAVAGLLARDAVVVVRDGPRGCHLRVGGETTYLPGHPQEPVDTNGAGDTHTGALLAGSALGTDWPTAAARANIAAAIAVTRPGPSSAPTRAEVDAFTRSVDEPAGS